MAWRRPGDKPLFEPMMVSLLTHICVTRPQWVKNYVHRLHVLYCVSLCFRNCRFRPYLSGLLHWRWGKHMTDPVPVKPTWGISLNESRESTKQIYSKHNMEWYRKKYSIYCSWYHIRMARHYYPLLFLRGYGNLSTHSIEIVPFHKDFSPSGEQLEHPKSGYNITT